jgi:general secretion pathway protein D
MKIHPLLFLVALTATLSAEIPPDGGSDTTPRNLSICYETFSVPLALAAKLQREDKTDAEIYSLLGAARDKDGVRLESFDLLSSKSNVRAKEEHISERIYPTEYEPPSAPVNVGAAVVPSSANGTSSGASENVGKLNAPATPTAFDTRNTGRTLEIEATLADEPPDSIIHLRLVPEHVTFVGRSSWGIDSAKTEMPTFETQRINTSLTARADQPLLIGTINRPRVSKVDPDSARRVWFAFITVTVVKP